MNAPALVVSRDGGRASRVAVASAAALVLVSMALAPGPMVLLTAVWVVPVAAASVVDSTTARLPDVIVLPGFLAVLATALPAGRFVLATIGAAVLTLPMLIVHLARPDGLGFGDVKFALLLGAGVGAAALPLLVFAFLLAAFVHTVACAALRLRGRLVPFGPALAGTCGIIFAIGLWRFG